MIIPMLKGGLGNQLFQIANAYAYAKRYNLDFGINYNLTYCPNQGKNALKYKDNLFKNIPMTEYRPSKVYNEPSFNYNHIPKIDDVILDGYFQSDKYFIDYEKDVRNLFYFPEDIKNKVDSFLSQFNKVLGVHIRRGDYVKFSNYHKLQDFQYYINAAKHFEDYRSVICTDDWQTVNNEMKFTKAIKSPFDNEIEDLYLLSQCHSIVICNSSFSWWGAFLGRDKEKVVAPDVWFAENGPKNYNDIYRKDWIRI